MFDTNGDGKVSFTEFMVGLGEFNTCAPSNSIWLLILAKLTAGTDEYQKTKFAFDIYDVNKDGFISNGELFIVLKMMVGNNLTDPQVRLACMLMFANFDSFSCSSWLTAPCFKLTKMEMDSFRLLNSKTWVPASRILMCNLIYFRWLLTSTFPKN